MRVPDDVNLIEVWCETKDKKAYTCGTYLGRFQMDGTHRYGDYVCRKCKTTTQLYVDRFGVLNINRSTKKIFIKTPRMFPAYIEG